MDELTQKVPWLHVSWKHVPCYWWQKYILSTANGQFHNLDNDVLSHQNEFYSVLLECIRRDSSRHVFGIWRRSPVLSDKHANPKIDISHKHPVTYIPMFVHVPYGSLCLLDNQLTCPASIPSCAPLPRWKTAFAANSSELLQQNHPMKHREIPTILWWARELVG